MNISSRVYSIDVQGRVGNVGTEIRSLVIDE